MTGAIEQLWKRHEKLAAELLSPPACETYCMQLARDCRDIAGVLQTVRLIRAATYSMRDVIAGYGEIWSTRLFAPFLRERGRIEGEVLWIDARAGHHRRVGPARPGGAVGRRASATCASSVPAGFRGRLIVTGFIATTTSGMQTTLGRNGSDFSGSIFGALLQGPRNHHLDRCGRRAVGRSAPRAATRR